MGLIDNLGLRRRRLLCLANVQPAGLVAAISNRSRSITVLTDLSHHKCDREQLSAYPIID